MTHVIVGREGVSAEFVDEFLDRFQFCEFKLAAGRIEPSFLMEAAHDADGGLNGRASLLGELPLRKWKNGAVLFL